jgi:hypothetical protein
MKAKDLRSFLFRLWIKLHGRPLRLSELRPLWHEVGRFLREVEHWSVG